MTYPIPRTPAQRAANLSALIHDEFLNLGDHLPDCVECQAISGLLTGLVRMARELPTKAEYIEALVAECAETLGLIDESDRGLGFVGIEPEPAPSLLTAVVRQVEREREARREPPVTSEAMADHTTHTRVSPLGTAR